MRQRMEKLVALNVIKKMYIFSLENIFKFLFYVKLFNTKQMVL